MISKWLFITLVMWLPFSYAQESAFPIENIELSKNANAIINYDNYEIEILRQDKMIIREQKSVTVLNNKADYLSDLTLQYHKGRHIKSVYMEIFDADGRRIKKIKKSDFDDYASVDGFSLYQDNRMLNYHYTPTSYPFTVNFEYVLETNYTAFIPNWLAVEHYDVGVKRSSYTFTYPETFKIQQFEKNLEEFAVEKTEKPGYLHYQASNIKPVKHETLSPNSHEILPYVKLASNRFNLAGVNGTAENWSEFSSWMYSKLLASRNNISPETTSKIREMVKDVSDPTERAKIIYQYVQDKTRYVNVSIGIGGWQPMLVDEVDKLGYGDCKALTFYTKTLMDIAEVPAIYTAVYAGHDKLDINKETVSVQGNHVFLCLPREKDSIWLECTSQKLPFGFINSSTEDRDVLLIKPQGGGIVHTCSNSADDNLQSITTTYTLDENGSISGQTSIKNYGLRYREHLYTFDGLSPEKLDESFKDFFDHLNNLEFSKIEVYNNRDNMSYDEEIAFTAKKYATINPDGSMIVTLNALNKLSYVPDREKNRKTDFEIPRAYTYEDSYKIEIPESYQFQDLPEKLVIENPFGSYELSVDKESDHQIKYYRKMIIEKGRFPKDDYKTYRNFRKKIRKHEKLKIIITKK